jgi:hypothetical protein
MPVIFPQKVDIETVIFGLSQEVPVGPGFIDDGFNKTLEKIGITEGERKQRRLTFHSLRHYCDAMLRGTVADEKLRRLTGHGSGEMANSYDHAADLDFSTLKEGQQTRLVTALQISAQE